MASKYGAFRSRGVYHTAHSEVSIIMYLTCYLCTTYLTHRWSVYQINTHIQTNKYDKHIHIQTTHKVAFMCWCVRKTRSLACSHTHTHTRCHMSHGTHPCQTSRYFLWIRIIQVILLQHFVFVWAENPLL